MGNTNSQPTRRQTPKRKAPQQWQWEYKNGRAHLKPHAPAPRKRPLFKKQPSNNYDWYIFK